MVMEVSVKSETVLLHQSLQPSLQSILQPSLQPILQLKLQPNMPTAFSNLTGRLADFVVIVKHQAFLYFTLKLYY